MMLLLLKEGLNEAIAKHSFQGLNFSLDFRMNKVQFTQLMTAQIPRNSKPFQGFPFIFSQETKTLGQYIMEDFLNY